MKWLIIPQDITLVDELTGEHLKNDKGEIQTHTFVEFMITTPLRDPEYFGKGLEALDARNDMRDSLLKYKDQSGALRRARSGDVWGIENASHAILLRWVEKPTSAFFPATGGQLTPYMHAIKNATDKRPDEVAAASANDS
jgi:hypothetical protein